MFRLNLDGTNAQRLLEAVCDRGLDAEAPALRALLLLLTRPEISEEEFSERLGLSVKEITAALDFFVDCEVLARRGKTYTFGSREPARPEAVRPAAAPAVESIPTLSASEAAQRLQQVPELQFLIEGLQKSFGRLLTQNEISHLISICDYTGLPTDVMLMIIEYAALSGKNTLSYVKKVALDWADRGIVTHSAADEQIKILLARNQATDVVRRVFGIHDRDLVAREKDYAAKWVDEFHFSEETLSAAYQTCVLNTGKMKFPYIDKVLTNWHDEGHTAPPEPQKKKSPAAGSAAPTQPTRDFMELAHRKPKL